MACQCALCPSTFTGAASAKRASSERRQRLSQAPNRRGSAGSNYDAIFSRKADRAWVEANRSENLERAVGLPTLAEMLQRRGVVAARITELNKPPRMIALDRMPSAFGVWGDVFGALAREFMPRAYCMVTGERPTEQHAKDGNDAG